jgi:hypothetical protein
VIGAVEVVDELDPVVLHGADVTRQNEKLDPDAGEVVPVKVPCCEFAVLPCVGEDVPVVSAELLKSGVGEVSELVVGVSCGQLLLLLAL